MQCTVVRPPRGLKVLLLGAAALLCCTLQCGAAVVGIEIGNEFVKAGIVAPGKPFEILLNQHSKRKTPSVVSFATNRIVYGDDALSHSTRSGAQVYEFLPSLLALNATDYMDAADPSKHISIPPQHLYPYTYVIDEVKRSVNIKVDDDFTASPSELLAYILTHIKHLAEQHSGQKVTHCVMSIPVSFGMRQRQALDASAEIAGLKVMAFVHDCAAAALQHALDLDFTIKQTPGTDTTDNNGDTADASTTTTTTTGTDTATDKENEKSDGSTTGTDTADGDDTTTTTTTTTTKSTTTTTAKDVVVAAPPRHKMFLSIGSVEIQACVVEYSAEKTGTKASGSPFTPKVTIKGCGYSRQAAGGATRTFALADEIAGRFESQHKAKLNYKAGDSLPARALKKILKQALKIKHVLSANKESGVYIESLTNDIDFNTKISRDEFEQLLETKRGKHQSLHSILAAPMDDAMRIANVTLADVEVVEMLGGAWRVPSVQKVLEGIVAEESRLGQHVNADEAAAFGATYIAANHSAAFRVRSIMFTDVFAQEYSARIMPIDEQVSFTVAAPKTTDGTAADDHEKLKLDMAALRKYLPTDIQPKADGTDRTFIPAGGRMGGTKTLTFKTTRDLSVTLYEDDHKMTVYNVTGIAKAIARARQKRDDVQLEGKDKGLTLPTDAEADGDSKKDGEAKPAPTLAKEVNTLTVQLKFSVSPLGVVALTGAGTSYKETTVATVPPKKTTTTTTPTTTTTTTAAGTAGQDSSSTEDSTAETSTTTTDTPASEDTTTEGDAATEGDKDATTTTTTTPPPVYTWKTASTHKTFTVAVVEEGYPLPMTYDDISAGRQRLLAFEKRDAELIKQENSRNKLEAFIYFARDKLDDEVTTLTTKEDDIVTYRAELSEMEDWLYGEGFTAARDIIEEKEEKLRASWKPMEGRVVEYEFRQVASEKFKDAINKFTENFEKIRVKMTWVETSVSDSVAEKLKESLSWFEEKQAEQSKLSPTDTPAYTLAEFTKRMQEVADAIDKMAKIPKPKPTSTTTTGTTTETAKADGSTDKENVENVDGSTAPTTDGTEATEGTDPSTTESGEGKKEEL